MADETTEPLKPPKPPTTKQHRTARNRVKRVYRRKKRLGLAVLPNGRPAVEYHKDHALLGHRLALLGCTNAQIASTMGIGETLLNRWMNEHEDFASAVRKGRLPADADMAASLYHRGMGYSHPAVKIFMVDETIVERDPATGNVTSEITTKRERYVPYTQHYPPDTGAASLWLRNRQPDLWKERTEQAISVDGEVVFRLDPGLPGDKAKVIDHKADGGGGVIVDLTPKEEE